MEITVNGTKKSFVPPLTVKDLLQALGINPKAVAVERNFVVVPRSAMETEAVEEGDAIEIIRMVGGG